MTNDAINSDEGRMTNDAKLCGHRISNPSLSLFALPSVEQISFASALRHSSFVLRPAARGCK
jgi:hypothetical protein